MDGREWLYLETMEKELFSVIEPDVSEDILEHLHEMAREALRDEGRE